MKIERFDLTTEEGCLRALGVIANSARARKYGGRKSLKSPSDWKTETEIMLDATKEALRLHARRRKEGGTKPPKSAEDPQEQGRAKPPPPPEVKVDRAGPFSVFTNEPEELPEAQPDIDIEPIDGGSEAPW